MTLPAPASSLFDKVLDALHKNQLAAYVLPSVQFSASLAANVDRARDAIKASRPERLAAGPAAAIPRPMPDSKLSDVSLDQRMVRLLDRSEAALPVQTKGLYRAVFEPVMFTKTVAVLAVWAETPVLATTHILAAVFRAGGVAAPDRLLAETSADIVALVDLARAVASDADLDRAASLLARLLMTIGADEFVRIMRIVAEKVRGGTAVREVYTYPPPRAVEHVVQERPLGEPPVPRSVLPPPPSSASPQAEALVAASESGVPFCEECAKLAAAA